MALITLLALAAGPLASSEDPIVPISQTRFVSVSGDVAGGAVFDSDSEAAPGFGLFDEFVSVALDDGGELANAGASQGSEFFPSSIQFRGSSNADTFGFACSAFSECEFEVLFDVTVRSEYRLHGSLSDFDNGSSQLFLRDVNGIDLVAAFGAGSIVTVDESGTLEPGQYRIYARADGSAYDGGFSGEYAFADFDARLDLTPFTGQTCATSPNSAGAGAELCLSGSLSIGANDTVLHGTAAPADAFGILVYGSSGSPAPVGNGLLCVGAPVVRINTAVQADAAGAMTAPLDFSAPPLNAGVGAIQPGSTWTFQWYYRDAGVGQGFNFSDGVWAAFAP